MKMEKEDRLWDLFYELSDYLEIQLSEFEEDAADMEERLHSLERHLQRLKVKGKL